MKPTYGVNQQGFDFGTSNLLEDCCSIFDMSGFPDVSPEDIAEKLRCRGEYSLTVFRKVMEIWEHYVDNETCEYLRSIPDNDGMSVAMMSIVLGETIDDSDISDAINSLAYGLEQCKNGVEAA